MERVGYVTRRREGRVQREGMSRYATIAIVKHVSETMLVRERLGGLDNVTQRVNSNFGKRCKMQDARCKEPNNGTVGSHDIWDG